MLYGISVLTILMSWLCHLLVFRFIVVRCVPVIPHCVLLSIHVYIPYSIPVPIPVRFFMITMIEEAIIMWSILEAHAHHMHGMQFG